MLLYRHSPHKLGITRAKNRDTPYEFLVSRRGRNQLTEFVAAIKPSSAQSCAEDGLIPDLNLNIYSKTKIYTYLLISETCFENG